MKKRVLRDISLNSLQVVINQVSGILVFYILSNSLDKTDFGEINWSTAVLLTSFTILGAGIDQLTIKKIAAGENNAKMLEIYLFHVLITGIGFYSLILGLSYMLPHFFSMHTFLVVLGISQLFTYFSTPFKQVAIGREAFKTLFILSVSSNLVRVAGLTCMYYLDALTTANIIYLFILSSFFELIVCLWGGTFLIKVPMRLRWHKPEYKLLIREALPLLGSIIFNSGLARLDWILLGIFSTSVILAEYSFAYKVFEVSTIPLLIIAPLLIPRFTRFFKNTTTEDIKNLHARIMFLAKAELIAAWFFAMILNIAWVPFIDGITSFKYGAVNTVTIFILSCAMPFIYINNLMWTTILVQENLRPIFVNIVITFAFNIVLNLLLIPVLNGKGAALAYLVSMIVQAIHFSRNTIITDIKLVWKYMILYFVVAAISAGSAMYLFRNVWGQLFFAGVIYVLIMLLSRQIKLSDRMRLKEITGI